ncbi:MAG TPA: DUF6306 domain-containing protein [Spirochaetota bacterium]|nr:DUF6306 domain-containing protein [Spirochaetota bacterium]
MEKNRNQELADFYRILLEAERAGVQSISDILPSVEEGELKTLMTRYLRDEGMNCQILISLIKNLGFDPGNKTGDFLGKIRALDTVKEKLDLLIKGQEWVAKQIRYKRELIDYTSSRLFMEAVKIQHEENVDMMKKMILNI